MGISNLYRTVSVFSAVKNRPGTTYKNWHCRRLYTWKLIFTSIIIQLSATLLFYELFTLWGGRCEMVHAMRRGGKLPGSILSSPFNRFSDSFTFSTPPPFAMSRTPPPPPAIPVSCFVHACMSPRFTPCSC